MINEYIIVIFFLHNITLKGEFIFIKIIKEFYIVDNLKANILLNIDILKPKKVIIDLLYKKFIFGLYDNIKVKVEPFIRENIKIRQVIKVDKT